MKRRFLATVLAGCLAVLTLFSCVGCDIGKDLKELFQEEPTFTYGDFECCYVTSADSNYSIKKEKAAGVNIFGLVDEAIEKEIIVIPEMIEGLPVIAIGMKGLSWSKSLKNDGAEYHKIYLPKNIQYIHPLDISSPVKKFYLETPREFKPLCNCYVSENDYIKHKAYFEENNIFDQLDYLQVANLTYIIDEKVYWIDDYEEGEYVTFPSEPIKEGYSFLGWYKEAECMNEWQKKTDVYSKVEGKQTVNLYAKWIKESNK